MCSYLNFTSLKIFERLQRYHNRYGTAATKMAHCRREGFVGLVESDGATKIAESGVARDVVREVTAVAMRDVWVDISDGTRGAFPRDAHANTAPVTMKRSTYPPLSKGVGQQCATALTSLQAIMALERER